MTKVFEIPFHGWSLDAKYRVRVTDKEEERDSWKRVVAQQKALAKFKKEYGCNGNHYLVRAQIREIEAPKPTHVCTYINSRGNTRVKYFNSESDGLAFCDLLDTRIKKGTCGGYSLSQV